MTDRLSRGQERGKDGPRVRLARTVEVALEPAFVQRITKKRAAPLPESFRCGHPRNEALKVAPLERTERDLGRPSSSYLSHSLLCPGDSDLHAVLTHDCGPHYPIEATRYRAVCDRLARLHLGSRPRGGRRLAEL